MIAWEDVIHYFDTIPEQEVKTTLGELRKCLMTKIYDAEWCRQAAVNQYDDGSELKVYPDATVRVSDEGDGAFVEAWVWVDFPREKTR